MRWKSPCHNPYFLKLTKRLLCSSYQSIFTSNFSLRLSSKCTYAWRLNKFVRCVPCRENKMESPSCTDHLWIWADCCETVMGLVSSLDGKTNRDWEEEKRTLEHLGSRRFLQKQNEILLPALSHFHSHFIPIPITSNQQKPQPDC